MTNIQYSCRQKPCIKYTCNFTCRVLPEGKGSLPLKSCALTMKASRIRSADIKTTHRVGPTNANVAKTGKSQYFIREQDPQYMKRHWRLKNTMYIMHIFVLLTHIYRENIAMLLPPFPKLNVHFRQRAQTCSNPQYRTWKLVPQSTTTFHHRRPQELFQRSAKWGDKNRQIVDVPETRTFLLTYPGREHVC